MYNYNNNKLKTVTCVKTPQKIIKQNGMNRRSYSEFVNVNRGLRNHSLKTESFVS